MVSRVEAMPFDIQDIAARDRQLKKAKGASSQLVVNALQLIDASLWLIAGDLHAQALSSLHNSIELLLKCELEKIHRVLIADAGKSGLDYKALKSLLKDAFLNHPKGKFLTIEDFDLEKTITFDEALKRTKDLYPSLHKWETKLKELKDERNEIIHYGGDLELVGKYVRLMATVAVPFIEMFLLESNEISLSEYVGTSISRELQVARKLFDKSKVDSPDGCIYALKTVAFAVLYQKVNFPQPTDPDGWILDNGDNEFESGQSILRDLRKHWKGEVIEVGCKLCGSPSCYIGIESVYEDGPTEFVPEVVACARCGLWVMPSDKFLASAHFGSIPLKEVDEYLSKNG
jgi:hypothetical protein